MPNESNNYSTRTFNEDYPNSSRIVATYVSGSITFVSWYNIISLGHYSTKVVMTQTNSIEGRQCWIPNNYIVKTEMGKRKLHCEIKYTSNQRVKYFIFWKENSAKWIVYSEKSLLNVGQKATKLSGPQIFGLDIGKLHQFRLEISNKSITSRKRPLSLIQSKSGQSKHFTAFGKGSEQNLHP
ncbi:6692_t:CDS:2 [Diversispora eburnea]|uniref:6692_t:CDS:1 n=1 Tax=Diversispora eburnea TaxID=1213867 RepID=A0A9N8YKC5_9GLOM|nr:6692_t:CDS:2 [Diversispora eburnea]